MLVVAPFIAFVLALSSVRTRRSAAATSMLGTVVSLLLTLLVIWGLTKKPSYTAVYQYMSFSVAFSGPSNFQTFAINLVLRADHLAVVALLAIEVCVLAAIGWHQVMGRSEPGAARFHAAVTALLFACAGILLSPDLAELFGFWTIGGALSYLLLAHRWGLEQPALRARVALALPFLTDICLLSGVAWLYARYGTQDINALTPILHTNPGWTVRSLVVASALLFVGVGGRLALWPFSSWVTQTATSAPTAASAIVQSAWSIVGIVVLYRLLPVFAASNQRTVQVLMGACVVAAVIPGLLGLVSNEPRRAVALVGATVVAIAAAVVINGAYRQPVAFATPGVAIVLVLAPARAGALLAISAIANAMRTDDLLEMGEAWRRMRRSSVALLLCTVVMGLSATGALAYAVSTRSRLGLALGEAVLIAAVGAIRIFFGASLGQLRRRRAFEPDRVRDTQGALGWPYWLGSAAAAFFVASLTTGWFNFLDGQKHPAAPIGAFVLWIAVPLVGIAACAIPFSRRRDGALALSAFAGAWVARGTSFVLRAIERFLVDPVTDVARRLGDWIPAGDGAIGRFTTASGQLALAAVRAPALPVAIVLAIALAVVFALLAPGVAR